MTLVIDKFRTLVPQRGTITPSGWLTFNAPCCHHRGHKPDTRKRAGIRFDGNGFVYHCFNCKFATGWKPGDKIANKLKQLVLWLGGNEYDINQLVLEALKTEHPDYQPGKSQNEPVLQFKTVSLPEGCLPLHEWINNYLDLVGDPICPILEYLVSRGFSPFDPHFYWTPLPEYSNRVIIPFVHDGKIVGYTGRKVVPGNPKYLSEQQPGFVFNLEQQKVGQRYLLVVEGIFDAIAVNGVSVLTNTVNDQQARLINNLGAEQVIVIPDQDIPGLELYSAALKYGWSVATPNWDRSIKDAADAVKAYGKLFTVVDAIKTAKSGSIAINMAKTNAERTLKQNQPEVTNTADFNSQLEQILFKKKKDRV